MIRPILAALLIAAPLPAAAQDLPSGCFSRDYSDTHLKENPRQNVASIRLNFGPAREGTGGAPTMDVIVRLADQGRARAQGMGGLVFTQESYCFAQGASWICSVECDGGIMQIGRVKGDTLDVTTDYFLIGNTDECGGSFDLAEGGGATTYRLKKAPASACLGG